MPLVRPPQGGQVTYAAARVRNINRCSVQFRGRFRDPATGNELGFDGRSADLVVGADGWGRPDVTQVSNLANIALCPDNDPTRDNQGKPAILEMAIADQHGHGVTVSQSVVPTCTSLGCGDARAVRVRVQPPASGGHGCAPPPTAGRSSRAYTACGRCRATALGGVGIADARRGRAAVVDRHCRLEVQAAPSASLDLQSGVAGVVSQQSVTSQTAPLEHGWLSCAG